MTRSFRGRPNLEGELLMLSRPTRRDGLTRSKKTVAENGPRPSSRSIRASSPSQWPESMALQTSSGITTSMSAETDSGAYEWSSNAFLNLHHPEYRICRGAGRKDAPSDPLGRTPPYIYHQSMPIFSARIGIPSR